LSETSLRGALARLK
jgi:hypothetical protein